MSAARLAIIIALLAAAFFCTPAAAQEPPPPAGETLTTAAPESAGPAATTGTTNVNVSFGGEGGGISDTLKILFFLSVLTLVPAAMLTMTSFTRLIIVLSFVRRALSLQQMPPNQVLIGLSLFLSVFIMAPVLSDIHAEAIVPLQRGEIDQAEAVQRAVPPLRAFMVRQTRKKELALFVRVARLPKPRTVADVPTHVLIPAFVLSEVKTAFQMGFIIFLPMLVIDLVVATLLTAMGMFMLPPAMVSVPLKILLFVLVDGWHLVIGSLVASFH